MTCNRFVLLLWEHHCDKKINGTVSLHEIQRYGREHGWLEEQDVLFGEKEIERRQVARILHQFLRLEIQEPDDIDWQEAMQLQDLFDCRTCVNHVAQMYVKGIMEAYTNQGSDRSINLKNSLQEDKLIFGMRYSLDEVEVEKMMERVFNPQLRICRNSKYPEQEQLLERGSVCEQSTKSSLECEITYEEAIAVVRENRDCLLIDVRSAIEFKNWHMDQAINIPMAMILADPSVLEGDRDRILLLYCERGYKSEVAARCLIGQGYVRVYSFGVDSIE